MCDRDLNNLVMNYLIIEGYESAARNFAQEANISQKQFYDIEERVQIRSAIHSGDIRTAIEKINELSPEVVTPPCTHQTLSVLAMIKTLFSCTTLRPLWVGDETQTKTSVFKMSNYRLSL